MAAQTTEALVLRVTDFGESDRIVHLLTPLSGRVAAIAKGARRSRRRFPGTLDFFNHLRVQLESRRRSAMVRLEHAALIHSFVNLRVDPARFALATYLLELLDRLAPEGGARRDATRLFGFGLDALRTVDALEPDLRLRTLLELRALDALGLRPELECCVRCEAPLSGAGEVGFHVADGGPVCGGCSTGDGGLLPVHLGTLRMLERGLRFDLDRLGRLALSGSALVEARRLLTRFQRFHLGLELRSERFLNGILSSGAPPSA